ncbi:MAG: putative transporter [Marmoricola sp.]|nr:putative transporter [Marmoricola sp.]
MRNGPDSTGCRNDDVLISKGDPGGTAFRDAADAADVAGGGSGCATSPPLATAIARGFANSLVAQAATSRPLYAMARDRQLPSFPAKVHPKKGVPTNATFLAAVVSLGLGHYMAARDDGITGALEPGQLRRTQCVPGLPRLCLEGVTGLATSLIVGNLFGPPVRQ